MNEKIRAKKRDVGMLFLQKNLLGDKAGKRHGVAGTGKPEMKAQRVQPGREDRNRDW